MGGQPSHDRWRREQVLGDSGPRPRVLYQAQRAPSPALPRMGGIQGLLGPPQGVCRVCAHALTCVCVC